MYGKRKQEESNFENYQHDQQTCSPNHVRNVFIFSLFGRSFQKSMQSGLSVVVCTTGLKIAMLY